MIGVLLYAKKFSSLKEYIMNKPDESLSFMGLIVWWEEMNDKQMIQLQLMIISIKKINRVIPWKVNKVQGETDFDSMVREGFSEVLFK